MSSRVADQLGTGASFSRTRGGVSARRQAVAATTGAPTTGAPDSRLRTLPLDQLVPTRFNPRRNFGTEQDLREFGLRLGKKQLQPAVAVTREAYLELWPTEADNVGAAQYVLANGERRYRGSRAAGLPTLDVVVDDDVAKSRADFLDAVFSENDDRENLDPIERALGIQTMAEELGGNAKVAEYYGKSAGWVTQQMYLLNLVPELQALVSSGELPVRETRSLVKLPADGQLAAWEQRHTERREEKAQPRPRGKRPRDKGAAPSAAGEPQEAFTAVKAQPRVSDEKATGPAFTAVKASSGAEAGSDVASDVVVPAQAAQPASAEVSSAASTNPAEPVTQAAPALPWGDPLWFDQQLRKYMSRENRDRLVWLLQASDEDSA
ncbi:ParB/RepB/Spo0J family partition protein [Streptomyces flavofungini]|uniref:ParB/RepB/Spo0J family partition protein n=1 Tax=Streptomyces flavofungini TaxID=68200 RepID=UPI0025B21E19|nr:ParB N-terminal domain-containing protein [Streptomyces flavofungini]WJV51802.1 ParB N-terminal domain-containing protein [Streptomyces flavofungini]